MPQIRAKQASGIDEKIAKKIAYLSWDFGSLYFRDALGDDVAKLQRASLKNIFIKDEKAPGLFSKDKTIARFFITYVTNSGSEKTISFVPGTRSEAWQLHQDLQPQIQRAQAQEKRAAVIEKKKEAFERLLEVIPRATVGKEGQKGKVRATEEFINNCAPKNITEKASYSLLGDYVVVDLETCGLSVSDPVLEVAAVRFDAFKPVELFTTLIDPQKEIPPEATAVNGITAEIVAGKPTIWSIMPSLCDFIGSAPIVGHNILFDLKFLYRYGLDLQPKQKIYDTCALSKRALKLFEPDNYKLKTCCEYYDIFFENAHRADADAMATGFLFAGLAEDLAGE